tara:strand:+ start:42 stop:452 length:411 start_codon:yes stop_codon:yes gene_type:complete
MDKKFHLDIITPTSIESFDNVSYLRIPSLDGLLGIQANHAKAIIGLDIGEIKINKDGKNTVFATSGGFADIAKEGVQLLLETVELSNNINKDRAQHALQRAEKRLKNQDGDLERASKAIKRAKNRLFIGQAFSKKK